MAKKRFQTLLPFALIAIVIAITLTFALRSQSARSEESTYEPGPYGTPMDQINEKGSWGWNFDKTPPTLPLRDLPPMPPNPVHRSGVEKIVTVGKIVNEDAVEPGHMVDR